MQIADARSIFTGISLSLSFSLLGDYSIPSVSERGASLQSYVFPRHKRNHILPRCALEGAYSILSTIHTRPTDSRSTDNLTAEMCWCDSISSRYPTFFDVCVSAAESMQKTCPSRCHNRWTPSRPSYFLYSPLLVVFIFFFSRTFESPFFRVTFVPSTTINRRDSRGTNTFSANI